MLEINFVSILVAGVVAFIIGFLMHGPVAGKLWMRLANIVPTGNEKFSDMYGQMALNLLANFVTAFVLQSMINFANGPKSGAIVGASFAFFVWLGYIVTGSSMDVIWMGKSKKLWLFELLSSLLVYLAMGIIVAVM